ncbi:MAG: DNA-processing protein DprA [Muribaculaceae bacterium]|nr:DNA-processing protein DprA [Muribaculaceae bacterium]
MLRKATENTYKVALSMLKGASFDLLSHIRERDIPLREFFSFPALKLKEALGINNNAEFLDASIRDKAITAALKEEVFMERHHIRALFVEDEDYPHRMAATEDPPLMLYMLGECDLNAKKVLGVVGTRKITPYGADCERKIIAELTDYLPEICIVSGLAYGADAIAHTSALEAGCPTVGVVAHGLDTIYPAGHRDLARRIIKNDGAILTEFPSGTPPYRARFLQRNRIVAWITDATLIVESPITGGAMSTANHAFNENRDVMAIPGRVYDEMSEGCNHLIRKNKASLVTSANDIMDLLGWKASQGIRPAEVLALFPEMEGNNKIIYDHLRTMQDPVTPDALRVLTGIPIGLVISSLTELEFEALVVRHPGNRYSVAR